MAKDLTHASNGSPRLAILTFLTASNLVALTRIAGNENKLNLHKGPISRVADALSRNSAPSSAQGILESYSVHPRHLLGIGVALPDPRRSTYSADHLPTPCSAYNRSRTVSTSCAVRLPNSRSSAATAELSSLTARAFWWLNPSLRRACGLSEARSSGRGKACAQRLRQFSPCPEHS